MTAVFSSVLYSQTSSQKCDLQRAAIRTRMGWTLRKAIRAGNSDHCARHAAAMVYVLELEAKLSPPVQREGTLI